MEHNVKSNVNYWEDFYRKNNLSIPSQFCAMVATEISPRSCVIELGCGNGRDSLFFASQKHHVHAVDLSEEAAKVCAESAKDLDLPTAHFSQGDLSSHDDLEALFERARSSAENGSVIAYSRFVMHSMNDEQESRFLSSVSSLMESKESIYFEFRSKEDSTLKKTFGGHYRRFVDTDAFVSACKDQHGFTLKYELTGRGMAKYKSEDPYVSRLIFEKN